jgi:hypothetical protein
MNVALIILIIVILILVLYLVYYVGFSSQILIDLNKANASIAMADIKSPANTSFTYNTWIYINNWSTSDKVICEAKKTGAETKFKLYLESNKPVLKAEIYTTDPTDAAKTKTVTITNNFPIQRWVYVVVSVNDAIIDCYLDGKLVKSQQLQYLPNMDGDYVINYGQFDAFLTKFYRFSTPTDPQTVWNSYMAGNGFSSYGPSYGFSFAVTKDQTPIVKYQYQ